MMTMLINREEIHSNNKITLTCF